MENHLARMRIQGATMKKTEIEVNGFNDENKWPIIKGDKKDKVIVTYRMSKSVEHKSALSVGGWNKIAKKHNKRLFKEGNLKKEHLLDKAERKYLRNFLAPLRSKVEVVELEWHTKELNYVSLAIRLYYGWINLPPFEKGTMYKKLEIGREYTLEELRLWKK